MPIVDGNDYTQTGILETLLSEGEELHKALAKAKTEVSKELVEEHERRIDRFRNTIKRAKHHHAREIDRLRGQKSVLDILDDMLSTDKDEARSFMFDLIRQEKELKFRPPTD